MNQLVAWRNGAHWSVLFYPFKKKRTTLGNWKNSRWYQNKSKQPLITLNNMILRWLMSNYSQIIPNIVKRLILAILPKIHEMHWSGALCMICTSAWTSSNFIELEFHQALEMIQIYCDIFEKVVPQHPLPFCHKHENFIFPPNGELHTFWW